MKPTNTETPIQTQPLGTQTDGQPFDQDIPYSFDPSDQTAVNEPVLDELTKNMTQFDVPEVETDVMPSQTADQLPDATEVINLLPTTVGEQAATPGQKKSRLGKFVIGLAVLTVAAAATAATGVLKPGNSNQHEATPNPNDRPAAEAAPAPITEAPANTVKLNPANTTTTVHFKPDAIKPAASAQAPESNEKANAAEAAKTAEPLSEAEKAQIIRISGFKGLEGQEMALFDTVEGVKVISINGAVPAVKMSELKTTAAAAKEMAAEQTTLHANLALGPNNSQDVPYTLQGKGGPHYMLFADGKISDFAKPWTGFPDSFTSGVGSVSIVRNHAAGETVDGLDDTSFYANVELFQNYFSARADYKFITDLIAQNAELSYLQNPDVSNPEPAQQRQLLDNLLLEIASHTMAYAKGCAEIHMPYSQYAARAATIPFRAPQYVRTGATYQVLSPAAYANFAS